MPDVFPALADLWLPILLSAVFVFIASSVSHMLLPFHKSDYRKLADEDAVIDAVRPQKLSPGEYMFPCAQTAEDWKDPALCEKWKQGPVGWLTLLPNGMPNMGKTLGTWFVFCLFLGSIVAYVGSMVLPSGTEYGRVFRVLGTVAILAYSFGQIPNSIWKGQRWSTSFKFVVDGVVYGLVTAGTFGWLWPGGGA